MSKFSEKTFKDWCSGAGSSDTQRSSRARKSVLEAIKASSNLQGKNLEVFVQGSYANNTNVKKKSDVDVCIMFKGTTYAESSQGITAKGYGFINGSNDFKLFRKHCIRAVLDKYGQANVKQGNKSIKILGSADRVECDIVPSFQYHPNPHQPNTKNAGVIFLSSEGKEVINYPKQHRQNGQAKNATTQSRYMRQVRLIKRIRHQMWKQKLPINKRISSFLLECLIWNIPNTIFEGENTPSEQLKKELVFLLDKTSSAHKCNHWTEVSGRIDLFGAHRKWNVSMTQEFLKQVWDFVEFKV